MKSIGSRFNLSSLPVMRLVCFMLIFCGVCFGYAHASNTPGHWIAIAPEGVKTSIEPLAEHRRREGLDVTVVTAEEIYEAESSMDEQASAIRNYLGGRYSELDGDIYVLLVGAVAVEDKNDSFTLPAPSGQLGRMKDSPSDFRYVSDSEGKPGPVVLGRLPGRSAAEIEQMVDKILRFEQSTVSGASNHRLSIMAGNPGGQSFMEKQLSGMFVQMIGQQCLSRIHPYWCVDGLIHVKGSEFYVPDDRLPTRAKSMLERGQVFSFYLGHSSSYGLWSDGITFLTQQDWESLDMTNLQGVFFSCGCYAGQLGSNGRADGYLLTAIRNPTGPVASIGASAESYGAIGQLAFEGIIGSLSSATPPERLGDYWRAVQKGISSGPMDTGLFAMYDYVDGSKGKTPLAFQRFEHLEMWELLGDPAMKLPLPGNGIQIENIPPVSGGNVIRVKGSVPAGYNGVIQLTLEKTLRNPNECMQSNHSKSTRMGAVWLGVSGYANDQYILDQAEAVISDAVFSGQIKIPELERPAELIIRAEISNGNQHLMSIKLLTIDSQ